MEVIKTKIEGPLIIEPKVFGDNRGYFYESYNAKEFAEKVDPSIVFVQDNQSYSTYGVLRGLHFQRPPHAQAKLVRVIQGRVLDVAVDIRKGSPTYGQYVSVELSGENHRQLFIPKGFAHGFVVLSETALFQYKCDNLYEPSSEGALAWDDADIAIEWPLSEEQIKLSEKDKHLAGLKDFDSPFVYDGLKDLK
ncbi:MAG: dTDP-4-dehydrorhamnose 3,5-epimerase [Bacteroidales bacterium]|nr:dTDP-4-dehydrorhamnose 3,5-epimerase [Bacteroidales bacterium]